MASHKPVIHGRDHLPGGADPIPGLTSITPYVPDHAEGKYVAASGNSVTVASGSGTSVSFAYSAGDVVLDLTTPTAPEVVVAGMYVVEITWAPLVLLTAGAVSRALLQFNAARLKYNYSIFTYGAYDLPSPGSTPVAQGFVALTGVLSPGDTITFQIENYDSASRDFTIDTIEVTRLYAL